MPRRSPHVPALPPVALLPGEIPSMRRAPAPPPPTAIEVIWTKVPRVFPTIYEAHLRGWQLRIEQLPGNVRRPDARFMLLINGQDVGTFPLLRGAQDGAVQYLVNLGSIRQPDAVRHVTETATAASPKKPATPRRRPAAGRRQPAEEVVTTPAQIARAAEHVPDSPRTEVSEVTSTPVGAVLETPQSTDVAPKKIVEADGHWSGYQRAVFEWIAQGTGDAVVVARAGAGKTYTMVEAITRIPADKRILAVAFNRSIRDELKGRLKGRVNVDVQTLNGHGFRAIAQAWDPVVVPRGGDAEAEEQDEARFRAVLSAAGVPRPVVPWYEFAKHQGNVGIFEKVAIRHDLLAMSPEEYRATPLRDRDKLLSRAWDIHVRSWNRHLDALKNLIELCRSLLAMEPAAITEVQNEFRLLTSVKRRVEVGRWPGGKPKMEMQQLPWSFFDAREAMRALVGQKTAQDTYTTADVHRWVMAAQAASLVRPVDSRIARFDCVFPVAVLDDVVPRQYDYIFVDETQDMDPAQLRLVLKSRAPGGRIVCIGDDRQAIYRFRGADTRAIPRMISELNATVLPLSISYRVPKCAAAIARRVVKDFETPDDAPWGTCEPVTAKQMLRNWQDGDFVISYTNKPLVPLAMIAVAQGHVVLAMGLGNLTKALLSIVREVTRFAPGAKTTDAFVEALERWAGRRGKDIRDHEREKRRDRRTGKVSKTDEQIDELPVVVEFDLGVQAVANMARRAKSIDDLDEAISRLTISAKKAEQLGEKEREGLLAGKLVFTTVHKIKGAEANTTWVLDETFRFRDEIDAAGRPVIIGAEDMTNSEMAEHVNLRYVAITRAKNIRPDKKTGAPGVPGRLFFVQNLKEVLSDEYTIDEEGE